MKNKRFICYTATHNHNGLVYVGISSRKLEQRKNDHKHQARRGKAGRFPEAIRKFGIDGFNWKEVAEGEEDVMRLVERLLIYEWDTANPDYGYNEKGGVHPAQIRYQLKKESWKHFGPPWNQPIPEHERANLEFEKMVDENVDALYKMYVVEDIVSWIEQNKLQQGETLEQASRTYCWQERLNKVFNQLSRQSA